MRQKWLCHFVDKNQGTTVIRSIKVVENGFKPRSVSKTWQLTILGCLHVVETTNIKPQMPQMYYNESICISWNVWRNKLYLKDGYIKLKRSVS